MQIGKIANISEPLLFYRISKEQVSTKYKVNQINNQAVLNANNE